MIDTSKLKIGDTILVPWMNWAENTLEYRQALFITDNHYRFGPKYLQFEFENSPGTYPAKIEECRMVHVMNMNTARQVALLSWDGYLNKEIADKLEISESEVKSYLQWEEVKEMFVKMELATRYD
jgi:DNA-binding NarL/FixJ family response regulator